MSRKAFVFGSNGPADANPLNYALLDADRFASTLEGSRCRFTVTRPPVDAQAYMVIHALNREAEQCTPEDTFICYFSGHGLLLGGKLNLLLASSRAEQPLTSYVTVDDLVRAMTSCPASSKLLVLDCCHAGAVISSAGFKQAASRQVAVSDLRVEPENHLVLMASDRLELAREFAEYQGSFLTHYLCDALADRHEEADRDRDGRISIEELRQWLQKQARDHNSNFGDKRVPVPYLFGRQRGDFFLSGSDHSWTPCVLKLWDLDFAVVPGRFGNEAMLLSKHPITNGTYGAAVRAGALPEPVGEHYTLGKWKGPFSPWNDSRFSDENQPVVCVNLDDARQFANWATRQFKGNASFSLPWPSVWDRAAFGMQTPPTNPKDWSKLQQRFHHRAKKPIMIESDGSRTNPWGFSDLIGNVWEWCESGDDVFRGAAIRSRRARRGSHPLGLIALGNPGPSYEYAELRGGSFLDNVMAIRLFLDSFSLRDGNRTRHSDLGFRLQAKVPFTLLPDGVRDRLDMSPEPELFSHHMPVSA